MVAWWRYGWLHACMVVVIPLFSNKPNMYLGVFYILFLFQNIKSKYCTLLGG